LTAEGSISGSNEMPKGILLGNEDKDGKRERQQHKASGGEVIGVNERSVAVEDEEERQHQQPAFVIPHFGHPKGTTESNSREAKEYKAVIENKDEQTSTTTSEGNT
jgi:hypothetical protein